MPAFLPTNSSQVQAFANALYGITLGSNTVSGVNADITAAGGLNNALNAYYAASFGTTSVKSVGDTVAANIGLTGDAGKAASTYIQGQLTGKTANGGSIIMSILNMFAGMTADTTYGSAATAWNTTVLNAVTYQASNSLDATTAVAASKAAAAASQPTSVPLTVGTDTIAATTSAISVSGTAGVSSSGALLNSSSSAATISQPITLAAASTISSSGTGGLTLSGNITTAGFNLTIDGSNATNISTGVISGTGGLVKSGTGTLTLSGASTYTGGTTISNGIIKVGKSSTTSPSFTDGALGTGTVTVNNTGALDLNTYTVANALSLSGTGYGSSGALKPVPLSWITPLNVVEVLSPPLVKVLVTPELVVETVPDPAKDPIVSLAFTL